MCGTVGTALVCNLPGSSNGALECLEVILPAAARTRSTCWPAAGPTRSSTPRKQRHARGALRSRQHHLTIGDVDIDDPAPGRVRVRVHHCGICHSDYTALHSTYGASPSVLGHEAAGVVDAVGEGVTMVAPGDKVVLTPIAPCGRCYWCQRDQPGCCVNNAGGARRRVPRRLDRPVARRRSRCSAASASAASPSTR